MSSQQPVRWQRSALPAPMNVEGVRLFRSGNEAILAAIHLAGYVPGESVLIPEYICRELTDFLESNGIGIQYYRIRKDLSADIEDIGSRMDVSTRAVIGVHYFGFPKALHQLKDSCHREGVTFIEDNAHGFLGQFDGVPLGKWGDLGILSMRKTVFTPEGAALVINGSRYNSKQAIQAPLPKPGFVRAYWILRLMMKAWIHRYRPVANLLARFRTANVPPPQIQYVKNGMSRISTRSWVQLVHTDFTFVYRRRRQNYQRLVEWLRNSEECLILEPDLSSGICPQVLPVLVAEGQSTISRLHSLGIGANYWPNLPGEVSRNPARYKMANQLRDRLVTLPIHQYERIRVPESGSTRDKGMVHILSKAYG